MKNLNLLSFLLLFSVFVNAQEEKTIDTTKTDVLDEILLKSVRINKDAPIAHSSLTKEELEPRNLGQDLPVLMSYLPSVVSSTDAGAGIGYTSMRIRGISAQGTNVTINGIPYNDAESQGTFWVNLPDFTSSIENLQLQRGVGTSTNGSGAFGASLNLLTNSVKTDAEGQISSSLGSYNTKKGTLNFSSGLISDHFEISGRLSKITSDGYIDRATSNLSSYFLQTAYKKDNTLIKALTFGGHEQTYQAWYGIDPYTLETRGRTYNFAGIYFDENDNEKFYNKEEDNYKQDHYQLHWNQKLSDKVSTNVGLNYTYGRGYYEQYKEDDSFADYGVDDVDANSTSDIIRRRWLDNDFYVANASVNYKHNKTDLVSGLSYSLYDGDHFGKVIWSKVQHPNLLDIKYYDDFGKKTDLSAFAKVNQKLNDKLIAYLDLQYRTVNYKATGLLEDEVNDTFNFVNPKAGLTYLINTKNHVYASFARANREPNRTDYENGNPEHEELNDLELGWRFGSAKSVINVNLYHMMYDNQLVFTGEIDDVGAQIRTNIGKSSRSGIEVDANVKVSEKLTVNQNITYSKNINKDFNAQLNGESVNLGNTNIAFSPEIIAGNIISYSPCRNFNASFLTKFVSEQYMSNIESDYSKLDAYFTNDLNLSYEFKLNDVFSSVTINGLVNNLFDVEYISNGYYYSYDDTWSEPNQTTTIEGVGYYPQATRNFLIGATLKF